MPMRLKGLLIVDDVTSAMVNHTFLFYVQRDTAVTPASAASSTRSAHALRAPLGPAPSGSYLASRRAPRQRLSPREKLHPPLFFGDSMSAIRTGPRTAPASVRHRECSREIARQRRVRASLAASAIAWFLPGDCKRVSGDPGFREVGDS